MSDLRGNWKKKEAVTVSPIVRQLVSIMDGSGSTYTQIAERVGVCRETLTLWKRGHRLPSLRDFETVAQALGYEIELRPAKEGA